MFIQYILTSVTYLNCMNSWLHDQLEQTTLWLYNKLILSPTEADDFYGPWISMQGMCILINNIIDFNFPGVTRILFNELASMRKDEKISRNPIINGYILERIFFNELG